MTPQETARYVLVEKSVFDEYVRVMREVNASLAKLGAEREKTVSRLIEVERSMAETLEAALKLKGMYEDLLEENRILAAALGSGAGKRKELN